MLNFEPLLGFQSNVVVWTINFKNNLTISTSFVLTIGISWIPTNFHCIIPLWKRCRLVIHIHNIYYMYLRMFCWIWSRFYRRNRILKRSRFSIIPWKKNIKEHVLESSAKSSTCMQYHIDKGIFFILEYLKTPKDRFFLGGGVGLFFSCYLISILSNVFVGDLFFNATKGVKWCYAINHHSNLITAYLFPLSTSNKSFYKYNRSISNLVLLNKIATSSVESHGFCVRSTLWTQNSLATMLVILLAKQ